MAHKNWETGKQHKVLSEGCTTIKLRKLRPKKSKSISSVIVLESQHQEGGKAVLLTE